MLKGQPSRIKRFNSCNSESSFNALKNSEKVNNGRETSIQPQKFVSLHVLRDQYCNHDIKHLELLYLYLFCTILGEY